MAPASRAVEAHEPSHQTIPQSALLKSESWGRVCFQAALPSRWQKGKRGIPEAAVLTEGCSTQRLTAPMEGPRAATRDSLHPRKDPGQHPGAHCTHGKSQAATSLVLGPGSAPTGLLHHAAARSSTKLGLGALGSSFSPLRVPPLQALLGSQCQVLFVHTVETSLFPGAEFSEIQICTKAQIPKKFHVNSMS